MNKIIKQAVEKFGNKQLDIAQEELAELIQAISKYKRYGDRTTVIEEFTDVMIMMEQTKLLLKITDKELVLMRHKKLQKLEKYL